MEMRGQRNAKKTLGLGRKVFLLLQELQARRVVERQGRELLGAEFSVAVCP
jgi:hypothetical protein